MAQTAAATPGVRESEEARAMREQAEVVSRAHAKLASDVARTGILEELHEEFLASIVQDWLMSSDEGTQRRLHERAILLEDLVHDLVERLDPDTGPERSEGLWRPGRFRSIAQRVLKRQEQDR